MAASREPYRAGCLRYLGFSLRRKANQVRQDEDRRASARTWSCRPPRRQTRQSTWSTQARSTLLGSAYPAKFLAHRTDRARRELPLRSWTLAKLGSASPRPRRSPPPGLGATQPTWAPRVLVGSGQQIGGNWPPAFARAGAFQCNLYSHMGSSVDNELPEVIPIAWILHGDW